jgi:hypothetical protein
MVHAAGGTPVGTVETKLVGNDSPAKTAPDMARIAATHRNRAAIMAIPFAIPG